MTCEPMHAAQWVVSGLKTWTRLVCSDWESYKIDVSSGLAATSHTVPQISTLANGNDLLTTPPFWDWARPPSPKKMIVDLIGASGWLQTPGIRLESLPKARNREGSPLQFWSGLRQLCWHQPVTDRTYNMSMNTFLWPGCTWDLVLAWGTLPQWHCQPREGLEHFREGIPDLRLFYLIFWCLRLRARHWYTGAWCLQQKILMATNRTIAPSPRSCPSHSSGFLFSPPSHTQAWFILLGPAWRVGTTDTIRTRRVTEKQQCKTI